MTELQFVRQLNNFGFDSTIDDALIETISYSGY